jgi:hypothetical protein
MPAKDTIHNLVKEAISKDGWQITDDPYVISYGERFLFVDLGATVSSAFEKIEGGIIGAEREGKRIAIEIKEFRGQSAIADLEQAIGQYMLYRVLLKRIDPTRQIYLAITASVYSDIFSEPIGEAVISDLSLKLIIIDSDKAEVSQWIPSRPTETSSSK